MNKLLSSIALAMIWVVTPSAQAADSDFLASQTLVFHAANADQTLERTVENLRDIFQLYQPAVDSSMRIVSPLRVTGPEQHPVVQVSIQKCVAIVCETVDLDAEMSISQTRGSCQKNYVLTADLSHSSARLSDIYDSLEVSVCFNDSRNGQNGRLQMNAYGHHAAQYSGGLIQNEIFKVLQLQIHPITTAISEALNANGAKNHLL